MNITNSNSVAAPASPGQSATAAANTRLDSARASTAASDGTTGPLSGVNASIERDAAKLSLMGRLSSMLDDLRDAAHALQSNGLQTGVGVSGKGVSAELNAGHAAAATHQVDVSQLAQAQQLMSPAVKDSGAALGTGAASMIRIDVGGAIKLVKLDGASNSLDGIAAALQSSGVDASVVHGAQGYQLRIDGDSGAANGMRISVSGDATLKTLLDWPAAGKVGMTQTAAAQDAIVGIDGKTVRSASNTLSGAIDGVDLHLEAVGAAQVTVKTDAASAGTNAKEFVAQVNRLSAQLASLKSDDASSNLVLSQVKSQLGQALGKLNQKDLASIGISNRNGALAVDDKTFDAAVAADPDRVARLFSNAGGGVAAAVAATLDQQLGGGGTVAAAQAGVKQELDGLNRQKATLGNAMQRQASLAAQQYANMSAGSLSAFGSAGIVPKMSLFDYI